MNVMADGGWQMASQSQVRGVATAVRPRTLDVSHLAPGAFGYRSILWWGTMGIVVIEAMAFALTIGAYFYLRTRSTHWPPNLPPPDLFWGSVNTLVLVASAIPNELARRAADKVDLGRVRLWMVVCLAFGVAFNVIRIFEFGSLNCRWDTNAYGSIVWFLLGLHTTHILTDLLDTMVLTVLMFVGPIEEKRFVDVSENSGYWYFVVVTWLPIYGVIYWAPRLI
jgi:heme/copper-type cytochrome/quinol oxidase subunit 3